MRAVDRTHYTDSEQSNAVANLDVGQRYINTLRPMFL